jgi:hypothetical protein
MEVAMNHRIPALLGAALFSFLGLFGQSQEYGDLTGALKRTVAQSMPPYHPVTDSEERMAQSGALGAEPQSPANPPAAAERGTAPDRPNP